MGNILLVFLKSFLGDFLENNEIFEELFGAADAGINAAFETLAHHTLMIEKSIGLQLGSFNTEANVCVFISKQGVEYSNYEMPEVEKYSPENLKKVFDVNKSRSEDIKKEISDKQELRNVIYQVRRYATSDRKSVV